MCYVIVDVGTQSLRSILFDISGKELFVSQEQYSAIYNDLEVEQDPRTWKTALIKTLSEVGKYANDNNIDIESISVTSQRASIIPVNEHGKYLYKPITYQNRRR